MFFACAAATISLIGSTVPVTFDIWVMAIILVFGVIALMTSSAVITPSSSQSTHSRTAPLLSRKKCQGTMLAWCSKIVRTISSPSPMWPRPKLDATRLIASVADLVKTISSVVSAFKNARTLSRAAS